MFQFPRCPPACAGARPCAGRVAPFGHPRISGCQRLPRAFRRVAASFLGRQRQGIHHAPFLRRPSSVSSRPRSPAVRRGVPDRRAPGGRSSTWARARLGPTTAPRVDPGQSRPGSSCPRSRVEAYASPHARGPVLPVRQRLAVVYGVCVSFRAVRAGDQSRAARPRPRGSPPGSGSDAGLTSPAAAEPVGFRVAHCQGAWRASTLRRDPLDRGGTFPPPDAVI